jgi:hypothetical protein
MTGRCKNVPDGRGPARGGTYFLLSSPDCL